MPRVHEHLKEALRNNDFIWFNELLEQPNVSRTAHLENNYVLKEMIKKGIFSSVRNLLKINAVWLSFDSDEMTMLSSKYPHHRGIERLISRNVLDRFEHLLRSAQGVEDLAFVTKMLENSLFITAYAAQDNNLFLKLAIMKGSISLVKALMKNNEVYAHCGLEELFLALKYSNHPGVVRELLKNQELAARVAEDKQEITEALAIGDFEDLVNHLFCLEGINDDNAMPRATAGGHETEDLEETNSVDSECDSEYDTDTDSGCDTDTALISYSLFKPISRPNSRQTICFEDDIKVFEL